MPDRKPVRDNGAVNLPGCIRLSEKCDREGGKVGPEDEVEGMEAVGASAGVSEVVLATKLSVGR